MNKGENPRCALKNLQINIVYGTNNCRIRFEGLYQSSLFTQYGDLLLDMNVEQLNAVFKLRIQ